MSQAGFISSRSTIRDSCLVGDASAIYGATDIGSRSILDERVVVGMPSGAAIKDWQTRPTLGGRTRVAGVHVLLDTLSRASTSIGARAMLRSGTVIYEGVHADEGLECAHGVLVRERCIIGSNTYLDKGTYLKPDCVVGGGVKVAGFVADRSTISEHCTVLGSLLHAFPSGVSQPDEPAPVLEPGVVVGIGAVVVGPVRVGRLSYIGANAVVLDDVPPGVVVAGNPGRVLRARDSAECPELWSLVGGL
jgi:serine acetyltransferase